MSLSMPTSFVTLKTAAKLNPDSRPPYVVEMPPHLTTTYGGIFIPWNSFAFTGHEKSPVFEPGIYASICGARLPASTWVGRLRLICFFLCCTHKDPPLMNQFAHYSTKGGSSMKLGKCLPWSCVPSVWQSRSITPAQFLLYFVCKVNQQ